MSTYRLAPLAEADLEDIWLYLAREASEEIADRVVDALTERFTLLATHPTIGMLALLAVVQSRIGSDRRRVERCRSYEGTHTHARTTMGRGRLRSAAAPW